MVYTLNVQRCCAADSTPLVSRPTPRADGGAVWADDKDDDEKWKAEVARRTQIQQEQLAEQAGAWFPFVLLQHTCLDELGIVLMQAYLFSFFLFFLSLTTIISLQ